MQQQQITFTGLRVLVLEDMFLVAEDLAESLRDWGCEVSGPVGRVADAIQILETTDLDGALLDVNLGGEYCFPVAAMLAARRIPFVFLTGYDLPSDFPPEFAAHARLSKPVDLGELRPMMAAHFLQS